MKKIFLRICFNMLLFTASVNAQDSTRAFKPFISYQINFNATLDKNIVTRGIIISTNRMVYQNHLIKLEPVINYRYGYVTPNKRPTQQLENDLFGQLETHLLPDNKIVFSGIGGYENSPNLRLLRERWWAGPGIGTIISTPKNYFQLVLYGLVEQSLFNNSHYFGYRVAPSIKGRTQFNNNRSGILYSLFFAQDVNNLENYRLRAFVKPYIKITNHLDLNLMYELWLENIVDGSSPREISTLTFGISFIK